jgi:hypothetical protein
MGPMSGPRAQIWALRARTMLYTTLSTDLALTARLNMLQPIFNRQLSPPLQVPFAPPDVGAMLTSRPGRPRALGQWADQLERRVM